MRISDWSSDVCSSDLQKGGIQTHADTPLIQFIVFKILGIGNRPATYISDQRQGVVERRFGQGKFACTHPPLPRQRVIDNTPSLLLVHDDLVEPPPALGHDLDIGGDRKSTRLNSSH